MLGALKKSCIPFVKCIPKSFVLFDALVSGIVLLLMTLESALFSGMVGVGAFEGVPHQIFLTNREGL